MSGILVEAQSPIQEASPEDLRQELAGVDGRVIDAASGQPIGRALVRLVPVVERVDRAGNIVRIVENADAPSPDLEVQTSSDGAFLIRAPEGMYGLEVRRRGYALGGLGRYASDEAPELFRLDRGRILRGLTIPLAKLGAITGRVVDERGEPQTDVTVRAFKHGYIGGRIRYTVASSVQTDDRGRYRLVDLVQGGYLVAVLPSLASTPTSVIARLEQVGQDADRLSHRLEESGAFMPEPSFVIGRYSIAWIGPAGRVNPDAHTEASLSRISVYGSVLSLVEK